MLPGPARPLTLGATAALPAHPLPSGRFVHRDRVESPSPVLRGDVLQPTTVSPTSTDLGFGRCPTGPSEIVCADNATCRCSLADQVTDAERAVMNDIARQAARLRTVLVGIFALVALTALVLLLLR